MTPLSFRWSISLGVAAAAVSPAMAADGAVVWQRWEHRLTSSVDYANPCADVALRVTYDGPGGQRLSTLGFWDGNRTFRLRCAFPEPGTWRWTTECSDGANTGLHGQSGAVEVRAYHGTNPLYTHGFLKVSDNRRYLAHADDTPFLWIGDTAWAAPMRASAEEWETYLADRAAKHFTVVQVSPASEWAGDRDREGNEPFVDGDCSRLNPAYWQAFERKIQRANEEGLAVMLVGLMEPSRRYPEAQQACVFARNIIARLYGNFVVFSPSFDSPHMDLANEVGRAAREVTSVHLITQHPGTPSGQPTPIWSDPYYDEPYIDIAGVQTGHNGGNREQCARQAIEWNLHLYSHEPHKPVINLEAMYDAQGENGWQAIDARSLGWRSMLSGAMGYTYGAGDVPPKQPDGNGAIWKWSSDPDAYDYWEKALQWESSTQMRHLHDFLAAIEWWRLEPAHELILNQPEDITKRMVLAKTPENDLVVAYLPGNEGIELDTSKLRETVAQQWFDPVHWSFAPATGLVVARGRTTYPAPTDGDWVLLLSRITPGGAA